jgi:hypothetical protein
VIHEKAAPAMLLPFLKQKTNAHSLKKFRYTIIAWIAN